MKPSRPNRGCCCARQLARPSRDIFLGLSSPIVKISTFPPSAAPSSLHSAVQSPAVRESFSFSLRPALFFLFLFTWARFTSSHSFTLFPGLR